jgi:hypothetical protein
VEVDIFSDSLSVLQNVRTARKGTAQLLDLIQNWPPGVRAIWVKAHKGLPGNEDADGVAKESVVQAGVRREQLSYSVGTVRRLTQKWAMREWAKKWRSLEASTSDMKKFFPELKDFKQMWKKGLWHWTTTSMVLGRLPLNGAYVGQFDEEKESEFCDCGLNQVETSDHFLFHCPKYEHLRLGWRWSQVSKVEKRYRWFAEHLLDIRSFIQKTKRFDDKKTKADNAKLKTKANNAKLKTKANNAKLKT